MGSTVFGGGVSVGWHHTFSYFPSVAVRVRFGEKTDGNGAPHQRRGRSNQKFSSKTRRSPYVHTQGALCISFRCVIACKGLWWFVCSFGLVGSAEEAARHIHVIVSLWKAV